MAAPPPLAALYPQAGRDVAPNQTDSRGVGQAAPAIPPQPPTLATLRAGVSASLG